MSAVTLPAIQSYHSISAATATGPGTSYAVNSGTSTYAMQVVLGGTAPATTVNVNLEGTIDGVDWFMITSWSIAGGQSSGNIVWASNKPCVAVRANLTLLSGGTAPTVDAYIGMV